MRFGIAIPNCREGLYYPVPFARPDEILSLAAEAERRGFDSVWVNDHYTAPSYVKLQASQKPNFYEPLVTLGAMAAITKRIVLAAGVVVLPLRDPILLARQMSTLDEFSQGRTLLAVGLGAYREEFNSVRPQLSSCPRGELLDESLKALKLLISSEHPVSFRSKFINFEDLELKPKPRRSPYPLYVGGNATQVIERVAQFANGWMPAGISPEEFRHGVKRLETSLERHGRKLTEIEVAPQLVVRVGKTDRDAVRDFRKSGVYTHLASLKESTLKRENLANIERSNLIGSAETIIERVRAYEDGGASEMAGLILAVHTLSQYNSQIELFAEDVMESLR
jgi:probable F420-dependent oxidoreductase